MTKKVALVLVLATVLTVGLFPQQVRISAGPKFGASAGWFSGDDWKDEVDDYNDGKNSIGGGFIGGAFMEGAITDAFAIQLEVLFFQWKARVTNDEDPATTTVNSLGLPLLARGTFEAGPGAIVVEGGPMLSFVLGDVTTKVGASEGQVSPDTKVLFAASVGAGYDFPLGPGNLGVGLRYSRPLNRLFEDTATYPNALSLLLGFRLEFQDGR